MKLAVTLLVIPCLAIAAIAVFVWSGIYNVAANVPHWSTTNRVMEIVRERSISNHSRKITPPRLTNPNLVTDGFRHYHTMCRLCHNAPGYPRTEISQGLYPMPPDFTAKDATLPGTAEIFWIVRNGIKMTGMPSFGATHSEDDLWAIVLFVKSLPNLKREEYGAMVKALQPPKEGGHHH